MLQVQLSDNKCNWKKNTNIWKTRSIAKKTCVVVSLWDSFGVTVGYCGLAVDL